MRPLQVFLTTARARRLLRGAVALLMLGLWIATISLAVSERLHEALHDEADHPEHQCPVTDVAKAQLLHTPVPNLLPAPVGCALILRRVPLLSPKIRFDRRLDPSRAPPRLVVAS